MWSLDKMQAYICHVKTLKPVLTEAATRLGFVASFLVLLHKLIKK